MAYFTKSTLDSREYRVFYHFIGASPDSTDVRKMLIRIGKEIVKEFGLWDTIDDGNCSLLLSFSFLTFI